MTRERLLVAITGALAAATWAVQTGWDRYDLVGGELLVDPELDGGLSDWESGTYGGDLRAPEGAALFTIREPCLAPTCGAMLQQDVALPAADAVVLAATLATDGVGGPHTSVALLHVFLLPRDAEGASLWDEATAVAAVGGTTPMATLRRGVALQPGWGSLSVVVQLRAAEGSARVEALSLRPGKRRAAWAWAAGGLTAGWVLAGAWATALTLRSPATRWRGAFLASCAIGLATLLMPARIVDDALDDVMAGFAEAPPSYEAAPDGVPEAAPAAAPSEAPNDGQPAAADPDDPIRDVLREAAPHFSLFLLIAALGGLAFPSAGAALGVRLLGFAGITEVLQLFTPDRGPALEDVAADAAGCVVGLVLARALGRSFAAGG